MPELHDTVLQINLQALSHNFNYLKSRLSNSQKFLGVVKAFAYGNDACVIASHLEKLGADYLAVAYTHEGVILRKYGITLPILVLHPQPSNFDDLIQHELEPNLYSSRVLKTFIAVAENAHKIDYPVHIKFNTGLNRLGFWENDVHHIIDTLSTTKSLSVVSVFSHLAASEDLSEKEFTDTQINTFNAITKEFFTLLGYAPIKHMCNTSGILNYPEAHFDMVRSGIGLYGFGNSEVENKHLIPIATLKSVISQIHLIEKGETVGYNRAYSSNTFKKIATIPIGHADGIGRQYGNGVGFVWINNQKASIVGNVCMDMIMVDITDINCSEGDEVIIFDQNNTAENLAITTGTISYELLTSISQRIKRKVIS